MKFIEARWHGQGGNDHPGRIVIHDAEYPEKITGAEDVAAYFQHVDRKASAHYVCDADSTVQCVKATDTAYHAPPNAHSIGIELVGYAKQTTVDWLDDFSVAMLRDQAAPLVRDIAATYGIPLVWLSVADLLAGKHGITSHNNVSLAFKQSTHTDPGGNFPIDQFMAWVTQGDNTFMAGLTDNEQHDLLTAALETRNIIGNLQAVANRDIDTLKPLLEQILQEEKDDPHTGAGVGDADPGSFVERLRDALVKGTAA